VRRVNAFHRYGGAKISLRLIGPPGPQKGQCFWAMKLCGVAARRSAFPNDSTDTDRRDKYIANCLKHNRPDIRHFLCRLRNQFQIRLIPKSRKPGFDNHYPIGNHLAQIGQ